MAACAKLERGAGLVLDKPGAPPAMDGGIPNPQLEAPPPPVDKT